MTRVYNQLWRFLYVGYSGGSAYGSISNQKPQMFHYNSIYKHSVLFFIRKICWDFFYLSSIPALNHLQRIEWSKSLLQWQQIMIHFSQLSILSILDEMAGMFCSEALNRIENPLKKFRSEFQFVHHSSRNSVYIQSHFCLFHLFRPKTIFAFPFFFYTFLPSQLNAETIVGNGRA